MLFHYYMHFKLIDAGSKLNTGKKYVNLLSETPRVEDSVQKVPRLALSVAAAHHPSFYTELTAFLLHYRDLNDQMS